MGELAVTCSAKRLPTVELSYSQLAAAQPVVWAAAENESLLDVAVNKFIL